MAEVLKELNMAENSATIGSLKIIHDISGGGIDTIRNNIKAIGNSVTQITKATNDNWSALSSDKVITPVEKKQLRKQMETIQSTFSAIYMKAQSEGIDQTAEIMAYAEAYEDLYNYIYINLKVFDDMSKSTPVDDPETFNNKFNLYYTTELYAQNRIANSQAVYEIISTSSIIVKNKMNEPTVNTITWKFFQNGEKFNCYYRLYADNQVISEGQGYEAEQTVGTDTVKEYSCAIFSDPQRQSMIDMESVPVLVEGSNTITLQLSNSNVTLSALNDGTTNDFSNTETELHVYEGTNELAYSGEGTAGTYGIEINVTYCTGSQFTLLESGLSILPITSLLADNAIRHITVTGKTSDGKEFTRTIVQTISKAKAGESGYKYLGALNRQPMKANVNDFFLATRNFGINLNKLIADQTKVIIVNGNKYLVTGTSRAEAGYIYVFDGSVWNRLSDKGSYLYTMALQDLVKYDFDLPENINKLTDQIVEEAAEKAGSGSQYYGPIDAINKIPNEPKAGSFFTWAGATTTWPGSSSGILLTGYVYLWNSLIWSELDNQDSANFKQLMVALPDILNAKNARDGYFATVFAQALIANDAFFKNLAASIIELQTGGAIKSKGYRPGSGNNGFQLNANGTFELTGGTIYGLLQIDKLHFRRTYTASESASFSDGDIWLAQ